MFPCFTKYKDSYSFPSLKLCQILPYIFKIKLKQAYGYTRLTEMLKTIQLEIIQPNSAKEKKIKINIASVENLIAMS